MKNILFLSLSLFLLTACNKNSADLGTEKNLNDNTSLIGTWQLVEQKVSIGGPATWQPVENGNSFTLNADNSFNGFQLFNSECQTGTYLANEEALMLTYNCNDGTEPFDYFLQYDEEAIILSPKTVICTETCEYKYVKSAQ